MAYFRDWFNRKEENAYSYYDDRKRYFSWDKGYKNYSDFLSVGNTGGTSSLARLLGSMFRVMGVENDNTDQFTSSANAKANGAGGKIKLPVHLLMDEHTKVLKITGENTDAFYGASLQNASARLFQSNSEYNRAQDHAKLAADEGRLDSLMYTLLNDERMHRKLADNFPGYSKFTQKYKEYMYDKADTTTVVDPAAELSVEEITRLVTKLVRFPKHITEEEKTKYGKLMNHLQKIFNKYDGIPQESSKMSQLNNDLYKAIMEYVTLPPKDEEEQDPNSGEGEGDGDGEGEGGGHSGPNPFAGMDPSRAAQAFRNAASSEFASMIDNSEISQAGNDESTVNDMKFKFNSEDAGANEMDKRVRFITGDSDEDVYRSDVAQLDMSKAQVLRRLLARKSKDYQFVMRSMRSGRLDTAKLAEAKQHVPTIYERMGQVKTNKLCIGVLIDESGSMGGAEEVAARMAATFINETFGTLNDVELFIYGHTADQDEAYETVVRVYQEPGIKVKYGIGSSRARGNNRDGYAILHTARRIRKFTQNAGVLLVLSDGAPNARGYDGKAAIEDTKAKVLKVESELNMQVIQIAINSHVPSEQMFKHHIAFTNIKQLPTDMVNYLSRRIDSMIKAKVTL